MNSLKWIEWHSPVHWLKISAMDFVLKLFSLSLETHPFFVSLIAVLAYVHQESGTRQATPNKLLALQSKPSFAV